MDKIISAIKAMVENPSKISEVSVATNAEIEEYFFRYAGKYVWSVMKSGVGYNLYFYRIPDADIKQLADTPSSVLPDNQYISYSTKEYLGSSQWFEALYKIVKDKYLNMDKVFDDIIGDSEVQF